MLPGGSLHLLLHVFTARACVFVFVLISLSRLEGSLQSDVTFICKTGTSAELGKVVGTLAQTTANTKVVCNVVCRWASVYIVNCGPSTVVSTAF